MIQLTLTLKMTAAQVVKMSVTVSNNPVWDCNHSYNNMLLLLLRSLLLQCRAIIGYIELINSILTIAIINKNIDIQYFILLHEKFLQSDWLRAHVKITNLLQVVV